MNPSDTILSVPKEDTRQRPNRLEFDMVEQMVTVSPMRVLNILGNIQVNRGYNTVALDDLSNFVAEVVTHEWTEDKLVTQLSGFYELVHSHQLHDIDHAHDFLGLDPVMIELVNAYEQARTNV